MTNDFNHTIIESPSPFTQVGRDESFTSTALSVAASDLAAEPVGFAVRGLAYIIDRFVLTFVGILFLTVAIAALKTGSYFHIEIPPIQRFTIALVITYSAMLFIKMSYYTFFHGATGQTVGKMVCGIKVVTAHNETIGYRRAFLRWIGYLISSLALYLGFLWVAIDRNKQGWHDKIAKTYVIRI